jgi:hypothetical protein
MYANDHYRTYRGEESTANAALIEMTFTVECLRELGWESHQSVVKVFLISIAPIQAGDEIFISYGWRYWEEDKVFQNLESYSLKMCQEFVNRIVEQLKTSNKVVLFPTDGKSCWIAQWQSHLEGVSFRHVLGHVGHYDARYHGKIEKGETPRQWLVMTQIGKNDQQPLFPHLQETPFSDETIEIRSDGHFHTEKT